jgi:hypothetical protein
MYIIKDKDGNIMPDILKETKSGARFTVCYRLGVWDWKRLYKLGFRAVKI